MFTEEQQKEIDAKLEAQKAELLSQFEQETAGLKATNTALKAEKLEAIEKAKAEALELEQRAIEEAKAKGELEKAYELEKAQHERKLSEYSEQLNQRNDLILSSQTNGAVKDIVSMFAKQDKLSQLTASQLVSHNFNDEGKVVAEYKDLDGNVVANSFADWQTWAQQDPDMKQHLAGSKASGFDTSSVKPTNTNKQAGAIDMSAKAAEINAKFGVR